MEPSAAFVGTLEEMSLIPWPDRNGDMARLKHLREALGALAYLERRRGLPG